MLTQYHWQTAKIFGHTLRDLTAEALLDTFSDTLATADVKTLAATKGEALKNSLADTSPKEKAKTLCETIGYVTVKLSVDSPPENLRPA